VVQRTVDGHEIVHVLNLERVFSIKINTVENCLPLAGTCCGVLIEATRKRKSTEFSKPFLLNSFEVVRDRSVKY